MIKVFNNTNLEVQDLLILARIRILKRLNVFFFFLWIFHTGAIAQTKEQRYVFFDVVKNDVAYEFYAFLTSDFSQKNKVNVKYFSYNAFPRYKSWKKDKRVLLVTAGGFVDAPNKMGRPIGLAAEEGKIINRLPDEIMDGLFIIPSETSSINPLIVDLDYATSKTGLNDKTVLSLNHLNPRNRWADNYPFFEAVKKHRLSVLQTQLLYSKEKGYDLSFQELDKGKFNRKRRYLVECSKDGKQYLTIAEPTSFSYLINGAKNVFDILIQKGFDVNSILNLDTGSNNILHILKDDQLINKNPFNEEYPVYAYHARIQNALNLLVFYE